MGWEGIHITWASSLSGQTDGHTPRRMWGQLEVIQGAVFRLGGWLEAPRDKVCPRTRAYPPRLASRQPALWAISSVTQSARGAHRCPAGPGLRPHQACLLTLEPLPKLQNVKDSPFPGEAQAGSRKGPGWAGQPPDTLTSAVLPLCSLGLLSPAVPTLPTHGGPRNGSGHWAQRPTPPCPGEGVEQGPRHLALPSLSRLHPPTGPKNISAQGCRALLTAVISHGICLSPKPRQPRKEQASARTLTSRERWQGATEPPVTQRPRWPNCHLLPPLLLATVSGPSSGCSVTCYPPPPDSCGRGGAVRTLGSDQEGPACLCVQVHVYSVCTWACLHMCLHVCLCVHVCTCVRVCACMYERCVHAYVHTRL